jgi:ABC-type multidrug transport system ATPase subunit
MNPAADSSSAVALLGFAKSYRSGWWGARIRAVESLTLRLEAGQVLGVLGPNGSGKSTLLKALAGLIAPTSGECRVFGHPAGSDGARPMVGYLAEAPRYPVHLTGWEFLQYCGELSGLDPAAIPARVEEVLGWSGLGAVARRALGSYSKGMRQRLGLAQAIIHDPDLLLLDEPASGLDPEGRLALHRLILDLAAQGKTIVLSSHLLAAVGEWCDRLAILGHGRLLLEGRAAELLGEERNLRPAPSRLERLYLEKIHA